MGIIDTFSKRKRRAEKAGKPDVFRYDVLPERLRVQIIYILQDVLLVDGGASMLPDYWDSIYTTACRELGCLQLVQYQKGHVAQCLNFILQEPNIDDVLDVIEIAFSLVHGRLRTMLTRNPWGSGGPSPDDAIDELNGRFLEHGIGYEFTNGIIIRKDSQFIHAEAVRPALQLLADNNFDGALAEFMKAHDHYRRQDNEAAMNEALKAFESTMKTICDLRKWKYAKTATAKALIDLIFKQGLVPMAFQNHLTALRTTLEGLPTLRNSLSGHGDGSEVVEVPGCYAAYALHLAATNIVFLVQAHLSQ